MAWIESHQQLARHPKTIRLAGKLKINKAQALGHLHLLWWWTLDYAPSGDLSAFSSYEIGAAAEWTGDADGFLAALLEVGWIDEGMIVHDWRDYAGKLLDRREGNRERQRRFRDKSNTNDHVTDQSRVTNGATVPNRTVPTQPTVPVVGKEESPITADTTAEDLWQAHDWGGMDQTQAFALLTHNFPNIDVWGEYHRFKQKRADQGQKPAWRPFLGWLKKASPIIDLGRKKPVPQKKPTYQGQPVSEDEQKIAAAALKEMRESTGLVNRHPTE